MVFVRIGAAFLIIPVFGEQFIPTNVRLILALLIAMLMTPVLAPMIPVVSGSVGDILALVVGEAIVGIFIGTLARIMIATLETAGFLITNQLGLSAAQVFNPALASPGSPPSALMGTAALAFILATNLHHMLILAVADSYTLFVPGQLLPTGDMLQHMSQLIGRTFALGTQLAAPFLVIGFLFNLGLGMVARMVPQIQVFFVGQPLQLAFGTLLFAYSFGTIMLLWVGEFENELIQILRP